MQIATENHFGTLFLQYSFGR